MWTWEAYYVFYVSFRNRISYIQESGYMVVVCDFVSIEWADPFCVNMYMFSVFHPQLKDPQLGFIDTKLSVGVWVSIYFRPGV